MAARTCTPLVLGAPSYQDPPASVTFSAHLSALDSSHLTLHRPSCSHVQMSSAASHRDIKHLLRRAGERSANGCAQCRKRKVKCDEQKPTCADCKRLRLTCTWSQRPWKFVHVNDRVSRRYEVSSGPPRNHSQQSSDPIKLDPIEFIPSRHYRVRSRAQETESLVCSSARYA